MVMFIMVITLEVTSMITCGQMVAAMTLICSTRDASPVSLATKASGDFVGHIFLVRPNFTLSYELSRRPL